MEFENLHREDKTNMDYFHLTGWCKPEIKTLLKLKSKIG
jgi:hypothetical protein